MCLLLFARPITTSPLPEPVIRAGEFSTEKLALTSLEVGPSIHDSSGPLFACNYAIKGQATSGQRLARYIQGLSI